MGNASVVWVGTSRRGTPATPFPLSVLSGSPKMVRVQFVSPRPIPLLSQSTESVMVSSPLNVRRINICLAKFAKIFPRSVVFLAHQQVCVLLVLTLRWS